ncbi:MAG: hypothetical protein CVU57_08435 [Deltaproteobacteria bacterium HGW-Deltaproteobacteria-15]|nr:MAG: hypothetical protein CVU57_08435 [Deltaproteobacteria bacterium HGW-Deltaproteobacteria-15]
MIFSSFHRAATPSDGIGPHRIGSEIIWNQYPCWYVHCQLFFGFQIVDTIAVIDYWTKKTNSDIGFKMQDTVLILFSLFRKN